MTWDPSGAADDGWEGEAKRWAIRAQKAEKRLSVLKDAVNLWLKTGSPLVREMAKLLNGFLELPDHGDVNGKEECGREAVGPEPPGDGLG